MLIDRKIKDPLAVSDCQRVFERLVPIFRCMGRC
ncbi:hypothetical protein predicted by Glimmer/Critica [Lactiplantibacillus plantarum]|nr:hypothetical protein predicted by Glimmer/Critica [Lactiplantibacillus plantarum]